MSQKANFRIKNKKQFFVKSGIAIFILLSLIVFVFGNKLFSSTKSENFTVVPLVTHDGIEDNPNFVYQKNITVTIPSNLSEELGAYGAAYKVWLGPKDWTGEGWSAADGTISVYLYPTGGSRTSTPRINYYEIPACQACILSAAAPYFKSALTAWNKNFNKDGSSPIETKPGLKVEQRSTNFVHYALPTKDGFFTQGAAYYKSSNDPFYASITVVLPIGKEPLAETLLNNFIKSLLPTE